MRVLMITGDRRLLTPGTSAYERLELQKMAVDMLTVVFWGKGDFFRALRIRQHFDVVTAQDPFWRGLVAWCIARRVGAKLNLQVHTDLSMQSWLHRALARFLL